MLKILKVNSQWFLSKIFERSLVTSVISGNSETIAISNVSSLYSNEVVRTQVTNPTDHKPQHLSTLYTINPSQVQQLYLHGGLPIQFKDLTQPFSETSLMVRQPALELMDFIKSSDLTSLPNKYVLYGLPGVGKTMSLAHLIHYLAEEDWVIVHTHNPIEWMSKLRKYKSKKSEVEESIIEKGHYDHTVSAPLWLQHFMQQNKTLLEKLQLVTHETYEWTQRDSTPAGSPLTNIVEFGISRARYACWCMIRLNAELKRQAREGRCRVAVIVDNINCLFSPSSAYEKKDNTFVRPELYTINRAFQQMFEKDWTNGLIACSVDLTASSPDRRKSHLPRYLLRQRGFEALDPFIPVHVPEYSHIEFNSIYNYYIDRHWLQHPALHTEEGRREVEFLSGRNGFELAKILRHL